MDVTENIQLDEGALAALKSIWGKMKSDFSSGYSSGQKFSNWLFRKGKKTEPAAPASAKEKPSKKKSKKPKDKPAPASDDGAKEKVKKFKGAKAKQGKFKKKPKADGPAEKFKKMKKGCGPAPKKKNKIRCPKPGGGFVYYDKSAFGRKNG